MEENKVNIEGKIEALLFLYGEPVKIKKLAENLDTNERAVKDAVKSLSESLLKSERGLCIVENENKIQLATKPALKDVLSGAVAEDLDTGLSPASMETLAIVAYLGPCRRSLIEHIRGVNSSFILRSLMVRGLIERKRDPKRANTFIYQITFDFLKHMGLSKIDDMPNYEKYRDLDTFFGTEKKENEAE